MEIKIALKMVDILCEFLLNECPDFPHTRGECEKIDCTQCWFDWAKKEAKRRLDKER